MKCIVCEDVVLSRPLDGPLSAHIAGFAQWVRDAGYALYSRHRQVRLAACFSRWLGEKGFDPSNVGSEHVSRYLRTLARQVKIGRGDAAALRQFFDFLHRLGVIPAERTSPGHEERP
jgi:integrase/recombinase XerD